MLSGERSKPTNSDIEFMQSIETDFKTATGLTDRSQFKIFYSPVWQAKIVVLGINPGGVPVTIAPAGVRYLDGSGTKAASSAGYCENGENDLVDCEWRENTGLLKLLMPILGSHDSIRRNVVKTNLAFARSRKAKNRRFIEAAKQDATPFLRRLLNRAAPDLVLLTGVKLGDFAKRHCTSINEIAARKEERCVNQTIMWPAHVRLLDGHTCIAVEVAHASQFNWIYERHDVPSQIRALMNYEQKPDRAIVEKGSLSAPTHVPTIRATDYNRPDTIRVLVHENPKRGLSRLRFDCYRDGMTVTEYEASVRQRLGSVEASKCRLDLKWDSDRRFIRIE